MIFILKLVLNLTIVVLSLGSLIVGLVYISSEDVKDCSIAETPTALTITSSGAYTIMSWPSSELNEDCNVTYSLTYSIEGGTAISASTNNLYLSIPRLDACSSLSGTIWAISEEQQRSNGTLSYDFDYVPTGNDIPTPTDVQASGVSGGFQITWSTPSGLDKCSVSFHISLLGDDMTVNSYDTDQESYTIGGDEYCITAVATVATVVNNVTGPSIAVTHEELDALSGLDYYIEPDDSVDRVVFFWNAHPKENQCFILYRATYSSAGEVQATVRTADHTATFNMTSCVDASLSVTANVLYIIPNNEATRSVTECDEAYIN